MVPRILVLACFLLLPLTARGAEPVTPQRPSFSSDANTTARGTLELETGYAIGEDDVADFPLFVKWGAGERTEVFVGGSPWTRAGEDLDGVGDTVVGMRHRFFEGESGAVAVQWSGKIPTADDGLGSGENDLTLALAAMTSVGPTSFVAYLQSGLLGKPQDDGVLVDHALALAAGWTLIGDVSGFLEVTNSWQVETATTSTQLLAGIGYAWKPWCVWDAAAGIVDGDAGDAWLATVGATVNFATLVTD